MFRVVAIIAILVAAAIIFLRLSDAAAAGGPSPMRQRGRRWQNLIWLMMLIGAAIGAITGIGTLIVSSPPIGGWILILHCLAAPLFAIGIAAIALLWAGAYMRGTCV